MRGGGWAGRGVGEERGVRSVTCAAVSGYGWTDGGWLPRRGMGRVRLCTSSGAAACGCGVSGGGGGEVGRDREKWVVAWL